MPVILDKADFADWLNPMPQTSKDLLQLLKPFATDRMSAYPVSTMVNTPGNDRAELIAPK
jgi:putative SOS response-associated peptidase YedK